jgi:hypothetical protein
VNPVELGETSARQGGGNPEPSFFSRLSDDGPGKKKV